MKLYTKVCIAPTQTKFFSISNCFQKVLQNQMSVLEGFPTIGSAPLLRNSMNLLLNLWDFLHNLLLPVADLRGGARDARPPPGGQNSFIFMQFSTKKIGSHTLCMKLRKIWTVGGGGVGSVPLDLSLREKLLFGQFFPRKLQENIRNWTPGASLECLHVLESQDPPMDKSIVHCNCFTYLKLITLYPSLTQHVRCMCVMRFMDLSRIKRVRIDRMFLQISNRCEGMWSSFHVHIFTKDLDCTICVDYMVDVGEGRREGWGYLNWCTPCPKTYYG